MSKLTLQAQQQQFANHLRDPASYGQPPGIESRRMAIYRNLFFNNIENFISSAFPIFRSLLTEDEWLMLIRDFFSQHKAQTPYFLEISEEFLDYLNNEQLALHQRFPFAQELCHYEWLELVLDVAEAEPVTQQGSVINAEGDLSSEVIILSPFIWAQAYTWPVHEIGQHQDGFEGCQQQGYQHGYRTQVIICHSDGYKGKRQQCKQNQQKGPVGYDMMFFVVLAHDGLLSD